MANIVLNCNKNEITNMKKYYETSLIAQAPPSSVFAARTKTCTITAYQSGKVLFQGKHCEDEAKKWQKEVPRKTTVHVQKHSAGDLPANISSMSIIGSDEVGTGDYFGPITVVAAYVKKETISFLQELGVRDSKQLTDEKICAIAQQMKDHIPHSLLILTNEKYNRLQQSGMSQGKMKALMHNQAIFHVLKKISPITPEGILIDQFVQPSTYYQHLQGQPSIVKDHVYFSTKAEGIHVAVAAASILARYAFVQYFHKISAAAGFTIPKGAGAQVDQAAAKLILQQGREVLPKFVKLHFANTEKALHIVQKKGR